MVISYDSVLRVTNFRKGQNWKAGRQATKTRHTVPIYGADLRTDLLRVFKYLIKTLYLLVIINIHKPLIARLLRDYD